MKRLARQDGAKPSLMGGIERNFAFSGSIKLCRDPRLSNKLASSWSLFTVPDSDLEMGVGGGEREKVEGRSPKEVFLALRASVWSKNKGGHLGYSAGSATGSYLVYVTRSTFGNFSSPITSSLFSCWFISLKKN